MVSDVIVAILGVVGSGAVAWAIYAAQTSVARATATMELLKEFNGTEMSENRARARRHVINNISSGFQEMERFDSPKEAGLSPAEHLYVVMRFYHRLNALRESNLLKTPKLFRLFGPTFAYWWKLSLEPQMNRADNWRTRQDIEILYKFFCRRSIAESRQIDWKAWLEDGQNEREKALGKIRPSSAPGEEDNSERSANEPSLQR